MKTQLGHAQQQHLVLTPQLRQALRLLQLSREELEQEVADAVASNPLLEWASEAGEPAPAATADGAAAGSDGDGIGTAGGDAEPGPEHWDHDAEPWQERLGPVAADDDREQDLSETEDTLQDHLLWQLHLGQFSRRERRIGIALIDAIDEHGYLREDLDAIVAAVAGEEPASTDDVRIVLHRIQQFDPPGIGARDLSECLRLQLNALPAGTAGRECALEVAERYLERLPRIGVEGVARLLGCSASDADAGIALLRSLDPRPGSSHGALPAGTYVSPDCVVWRHQGLWRVALASGALPNVTIQRTYQDMIGRTAQADSDYLRGRLQEARWLLKALESRADTLLRVVRMLAREQAAFLEFGPQALRPLTLREVAAALELHESTISRAVARKYVRTPRGTLALRDFFASGIDSGDGGSTSSTAIQDRIRVLVAGEDPRKPLSDARLADTLKAEGVPVARRTVAKYREALQIPASHERVRIG